MAETAAIAKMAEEVSKGIFSIFGWGRRPHHDQNWACVSGNHKSKLGRKKLTHPSDVVFFYDSPLEHGRIYINTDLKSYSASTITKDNLEEALINLSMSVECANQSGEWQDIFADPESNHRVYGMLFIYNHDAEYDKNFSNLLGMVKYNLLKVKANYRIFVFGPAEIEYLFNVTNDILRKRGASELPSAKYCKFYHPDLVRSRVTSNTLKAATAEMLLSPWQILEYEATEETNHQKGYVIYYRDSGSSVDELKFLIDYCFRYQLVADSVRIEIRAPFADSKATAHFETAKAQYAKEYFNFPEFEKRLSQITFSSISAILARFSGPELGMH